MTWVTWALLSALFAGFTAILAKIGVKNIDSNLATAIRTVVVVLFAWAIVFWRTPNFSLAAIPRRTYIFLILSGFATGLSWLCYFRALQLGPASKVAPIDKLSVVFVLVLSVLILQEKLSWHQWLGGALILLGALVVAWK